MGFGTAGTRAAVRMGTALAKWERCTRKAKLQERLVCLRTLSMRVRGCEVTDDVLPHANEGLFLEYAVEKLQRVLNGRLEPGMEEPKRMRRVGYCVNFGRDVELAQPRDHLVSSRMKPVE